MKYKWQTVRSTKGCTDKSLPRKASWSRGGRGEGTGAEPAKLGCSQHVTTGLPLETRKVGGWGSLCRTMPISSLLQGHLPPPRLPSCFTPPTPTTQWTQAGLFTQASKELGAASSTPGLCFLPLTELGSEGTIQTCEVGTQETGQREERTRGEVS